MWGRTIVHLSSGLINTFSAISLSIKLQCFAFHQALQVSLFDVQTGFGWFNMTARHAPSSSYAKQLSFDVEPCYLTKA